jgi:hypothetical protein
MRLFGFGVVEGGAHDVVETAVHGGTIIFIGILAFESDSIYGRERKYIISIGKPGEERTNWVLFALRAIFLELAMFSAVVVPSFDFPHPKTQ